MKTYFSIFSLLSLLIISGCTVDRIGLFGRYIGTYKKYDKTISSLTKFLKDNNTLSNQERAIYLLYIGIAYQKKLEYKQSMQYYDRSLIVNPNLNYFTLLQKADLYRIKNDYDSEAKYLNLALKEIKLLLSKIKGKSLPSDEINFFQNTEYVIGYYINKEKIKNVRQPYSIKLEVKIKKIENKLRQRRSHTLIQATGSQATAQWRRGQST